MTTTTAAHAPGTVVGDGTTVASRNRSRWQRARWPLAVGLAVLLAALLASLVRPTTSQVPFAPDSSEDNGARAAAEILREQGVRIDYVRTSGAALAAADAGSTLLVTGTYLLTAQQVEELAGTEADLVLAEPEPFHLDTLTGGAVSGASVPRAERAVEAGCEHPDALAAGRILSRGAGLTQGSVAGAVLCFPAPDAPDTGAYAVVEDAGRRVVVLDDASLLTNERLAQEGHAALVLRTLGRDEHLVWYVPSFTDTGGEEDSAPPLSALLPSWTRALAAQVTVVAVALVLWRSRRLGRVVTEPLPVTVRAAETTVGRGRLYRRSRSRGHAAAALRAGTARRAAARVGLPRSAGAVEVIDALARATGRRTDEVAGLLYGPPPTDDAGLLRLAHLLDELESEVHRT